MSTARHTLVAGTALLALALAGCADTQPGDTNNGPGYTENVSDLLVKIPAQLGDPCNTGNLQQIYPNCGRYVAEVANTAGTVRVAAPSQAAAADAIEKAVNTYQQLGCESISGTPTPDQAGRCPAALHTIGAELEDVDKALTSAAASTTNRPSGG